jgi:hypothetical protein
MISAVHQLLESCVVKEILSFDETSTSVASDLSVGKALDYRNAFDLTGSVAVISGGSRGIGYESALALGSCGARVVLASRDRNALNAAVKRLVETGIDAACAVVDVTDAIAVTIDETALIEALRSGRIRHAGLDVFHSEPLRGDHPLAAMDNVTLTAHAGFRTLEASMTLLRRGIEIVKNIRDGA